MASQEEIQTLVEKINKAATANVSKPNGANGTDHSGDTANLQLLKAARSLVAALEDPADEVWRFTFAPATHSCAVVAWKRGILGPWPKETMSSAELAELSKVDQVLIVRMMRAFLHYGLFEEVEEEVYRHTPFSKKLSVGLLGRRARGLSDTVRTMGYLADYLEEFGYENPSANPANPSLFSWVEKTQLEYFEWMTTNQDKTSLDDFNRKMAMSMSNDGILRSFPFEELLADVSPDEVAIVDVGGGYGHLLQSVRAQLPGVKGKLVVEDLAETVKGADWVTPADNVIIQPFNFFKDEQPIKGGRFYILRHVLHDWPDHACKTILQSLIPALAKDKSRILMIEIILENTNTGAWGSLMDLNMMRFGGMGRKERQWRAIAESAGLKMVKIWSSVPGADSIMELIPADWL